MVKRQPVAFLSYVRSDDEHENGRLTQFCERLSAEVKMQTGEEFHIFQDRKDIKWGENWKERIENTLDGVTFLIPIITPSFFTSTACRDEFKRFIEREKELDRNDLILPVYYVSSPLLDIKEKCAADEIAKIIASRQRVDWRDIRFVLPTAPEYGKRLAEIAVQIRESLERGQLKVITHEPKKIEADTDSKLIKSTSSDPIFNVPSKNMFFTGREKYIEQLHETLKLNGATALSQPQAISGLGGIGKTQTAIEYAYKYKDEYKAVFWVNADSKESLISGFVTIAGLLSLSVKGDKDQELIVASVKHWFETRNGWLLIFDNADDTKLVKDFFPVQTKGHIILTSRAQVFDNLHIMKPLKMDEMSPGESKQFLLMRTGRNNLLLEKSEIEAIELLAHELEYFPLALEQAGAYIHQKSSSFNDYLISYRKRGLKLLEETKSDDYPNSIATTWSLNFEQVKKTSDAAIDLLYVSAFLSPHQIPLELIAYGANELGPVLSGSLADVKSDPLAFDPVFDPITKYSLIERDPISRTYSIHRMVQAVLKDKMENDTQRQWAERTIKAVNKAFPEIEFENWNTCERILPHAKVCMELIEKWNFELNEAARLLNEAGNYLKARARYGEAKPFLERAMGIRKKILIEDHPDLAKTFNNLAGLYREQGKYIEAEELYNNALDIRKKILREDHPDLAETFHDFAILCQLQGKYKEAEELYNNALDIRKKILIEDHPDLAETFNHLAYLHQIQGKFIEAEELYNNALDIRKKILREDHPDLAETYDSLAGLYLEQGKYKKAEELYNNALSINKKVLGEDHPNLGANFNNFANLYKSQGKFEEAEKFYKNALDIGKKSLGEDHPNVAVVFNNLAGLYKAQGKFEEAEEIYKNVLVIRKKVLGENHLHVADTINGLADLYSAKGKNTNAKPLFEQAIRIMETSYGKESPLIIRFLKDYANFLEKTNKNREATKMRIRAKAIQDKQKSKEEKN